MHEPLHTYLYDTAVNHPLEKRRKLRSQHAFHPPVHHICPFVHMVIYSLPIHSPFPCPPPPFHLPPSRVPPSPCHRVPRPASPRSNRRVFSSSKDVDTTYTATLRGVIPSEKPDPCKPNPRVGVGAIMSWSVDGRYLATRNDNMASTLWVWDAEDLALSSVVIQV